MYSQEQPNRDTIARLVMLSLHEVLSQKEQPLPDLVNGAVNLIGRQAVLDSLGLVTLIVDLEQRLEEEYGISLVIVDEHAMSQRSSPFRTPQSLTDYICLLIEGQKENGRA
jgi:acyl carrier protein